MGKDSTNSTLTAGILEKVYKAAEKTKTNQADNKVNSEELSKLLSELLYLEFVLAEKNGVSLEETFLQTVDEYILGLVS